jgi:hypothetical protein
MNARYAPLNNELEAAFEGDDHDDHDDQQENQPLIRNNPSPPTPGAYDFENVDYDYPPPGSPPSPSSTALPNSFGNSNGFVPSFDSTHRPTPSSRQPWWKRLIPYSRSSTVDASGSRNDGVFANVTAKPSAPTTVVQNEDGTYVVPEETRQEAPPSYASAQADAVPPYWETTVHAPFSPDNFGMGDMIIDSLPTGSLFSFLWNMLVSVSFQFVGFLLTYLLHTTHAARLGSRAGLGVTLIQYGFALRSKANAAANYAWDEEDQLDWVNSNTSSLSDFRSHGFNSTSAYASAIISEQEASIMVADATTEWLSFFLMTVGWFILLTSLLGFWRVKRWERGILATQQQNNGSTTANTVQGTGRSTRFESVFGVRNVARLDLLRQGFGFSPRAPPSPTTPVPGNQPEELRRLEEGHHLPSGNDESDEHDLLLMGDPNDPNRAAMIRAAIENDRRLTSSLRNAGLI